MFEAGAPHPRLELVDTPLRPFAPSATLSRMTERRAELGDEGEQGGRGLAPSVGAHERTEADIPVVVTSDTGLPAGTLPRRRRPETTIGVGGWDIGDEREEPVTTQPP